MNLLSVGRGLRRPDADLPERPGRRARRPGPRRAHRQLRAADDVRRPLRPLDGLRGLPDEPRPGGLQEERRQRRRPWSWAWPTSGRVITSAALIMVSVFLSFVLNGDPTVKQFGVGLAVAVALDATIVRCLLVPALMVLTQRRQLVAAGLARPHPARASTSRASSTSRTWTERAPSPRPGRLRIRAGRARSRAPWCSRRRSPRTVRRP